MNKVQNRIADAEKALKKAKAIAIVYRQIESSYECHYCHIAKDDDGNYIEKDGAWRYDENAIDEVSLYDYDYDEDVYKMALAIMKKVLDTVADIK